MAFPKTLVKINALLQIWSVRLPVWATLYGLSSELIKQVQDDAIVINHLINATVQLGFDTDEFFTFKENVLKGNPNGTIGSFPVITIEPLPALQIGVKPGLIKRNTEIYNFLKNHPNRTPESLADLGITGTPKQSVSPDLLQPVCKGTPLPDDKVKLEFNKQGQKSVRWQMRRHGGDFGNEKDAQVSPFTDETPSIEGKPEIREYRGIYVTNNKTVGQYSAIITIYTTP